MWGCRRRSPQCIDDRPRRAGDHGAHGMRVMITGGGTGGHTSPAVAILEELRERDPQLLVQWVGRKGGLEERVSRSLAVPFRALPVEGWPRGRSFRRLWVAFKLGFAIVRGYFYIRRFRPQIVIGVGGYVSLPLVYAAQRMGVPTVVHEQNKRLGMANQVAAARALRLFLSYPETVGRYPEATARLVGNPVRAGFADPSSKSEACEAFGLDGEVPVVLVVGGSQGARSLNDAVVAMLPELAASEMQVLWMAGNGGIGAAREAAAASAASAHAFAFIDDMVSACSAADVIVSRAGASSTAEIAAVGRPSILVPYPFATDNHQEQNARAFEEAGAAAVLLDAECTGPALLAEIRGLMEDSMQREAMASAARGLARLGAAEQIVEELIALAFEAESS
jgi:UDP-N-acetylglucosamine--N-acetylmuramyl-(pentapeptide) pyrophosphoryl-undecaprenol N-acetylglucosamine transferase